MTILLVVQSVSQPSRVFTLLSSAMPSLRSFSRKASRIASEIWSQTLSGCPSDTDSLVNREFERCTEKHFPDAPVSPPRVLFGLGADETPALTVKKLLQCQSARSRCGPSVGGSWVAVSA